MEPLIIQQKLFDEYIKRNLVLSLSFVDWESVMFVLRSLSNPPLLCTVIVTRIQLDTAVDPMAFVRQTIEAAWTKD